MGADEARFEVRRWPELGFEEGTVASVVEEEEEGVKDFALLFFPGMEGTGGGALEGIGGGESASEMSDSESNPSDTLVEVDADEFVDEE